MTRSNESLVEEYRRRTPKSRAQWERGVPVMPGGVIKGAYWSPPYPHYVAKAEGCHVWDIDGNRYVDFGNHHSAMMLGHSHPDVIAAVQREVERGLGLGGPTELEAEIAEEITSRFPSIDKVRFCNSGTEASLHATRLVRAKTGRPKIAKFEGGYHGSHDALEVSAAPPLDRAGPADSPSAVAAWEGMSRSAEEDAVILPYSDRESVELILREQKDEIAGVFYDAKPSSWEVSEDFTRFIRDITSELGIPMVMDEVVSFRSGPGGAQGLAGVEPDVTIFGKAFGGGFPIGAIGGKDEYMEMLDNTGEPTGLSQSGTFSGNSFTLAAGLATIRGLTPEVYAHVDRLRGRLHEGLVDVFDRAGVPSRVVSAGAGLHFYMTDRPITDYRSATTLPDHDLAGRIDLALFLKGYSMSGGIGVTISAPVQDEHIDGFLSAMAEVLPEED